MNSLGIGGDRRLLSMQDGSDTGAVGASDGGTLPPRRGREATKDRDLMARGAGLFLRRSHALMGIVYRLPTEAEWEYASQSVKQSHLDKEAWYRKNSKGTIQQVAGLKPNSLGLFDMLGNVWEWTSDWYGEDYYKESPTRNPQRSRPR